MKTQYRLNLNELPECPFELPMAWIQQLKLNEYPDSDYLPLRSALAKRVGKKPEQIVCTNGSDELIGLAIATLTPAFGPTSLVLGCSPTFGEYKRMAALYGRPYIENQQPESLEQTPVSQRLNQLKAVWQNTIEPGLESGWQAKEHLPLLFLCSPNNPTGESLPKQVLLDCLDWFSGYVALDEAYVDFSNHPEGYSNLVEKFPKLLILKTLSKSSGLAGLRLGYGIGSETVIRTLNDARPPYNINAVTESIARYTLERLDPFGQKSPSALVLEGIRRERQWMTDRLTESGYICLPSEANFLLVKPPVLSIDDLETQLANEGIQIRTFTDPLLREWLRFNISAPEINRQVINILTDGSYQTCPPPLLAPDRQGRWARSARTSKETDIEVALSLNGSGRRVGETGIGFFDHMLDQWLWHGGFDLNLKMTADWHIDQHHALEDLGIVLGQCLKKALGPRTGLTRYGHSYVPMDESLARVVVDISGRGLWHLQGPILKSSIGTLETESLWEFFKAFAANSGITLHADILYGSNSHHMVEGLFKAFGRALKQATALDSTNPGSISTKGFID